MKLLEKQPRIPMLSKTSDYFRRQEAVGGFDWSVTVMLAEQMKEPPAVPCRLVDRDLGDVLSYVDLVLDTSSFFCARVRASWSFFSKSFREGSSVKIVPTVSTQSAPHIQPVFLSGYPVESVSPPANTETKVHEGAHLMTRDYAGNDPVLQQQTSTDFCR